MSQVGELGVAVNLEFMQEFQNTFHGLRNLRQTIHWELHQLHQRRQVIGRPCHRRRQQLGQRNQLVQERLQRSWVRQTKPIVVPLFIYYLFVFYLPLTFSFIDVHKKFE